MAISMRILGLIPLVTGLFAAPAALACSCLPADPDEFVSDVAIVFEGAMLTTGDFSTYPDCHDITALECVDQVESIFRVDRVLKGELGKTVSIWMHHRVASVAALASRRTSQ